MAGKGKGSLPAIAFDVIGDTLEGTLAGIGAAVGGVAQGIGAAAGGAMAGAGSALGGALQGALTPASTTIINNVGMVGDAAKKKVSGTGTIPAPKKTSKPSVNPNMPTEKLLVIAIKYLSSIDKTLQDQLNFERLALERQTQAEKEAAIESNTGQDVFSQLGDKLGASQKDQSEKTSAAADLAKKLIGGTALGVLGFLGLGLLTAEQAKLDEFKENLNRFREAISPLLEIASMAMVAAAGYRVGGVKGAIMATIVVEGLKIIAPRSGDYILSALGITPDNRENDPNAEQRTGFFGQSPLSDMATALGVRWLYGKAKDFGRAAIDWGRRSWSKLKSAAMWLWDSSFVRFIRTAATNPAAWAKFLNWLERYGGRAGVAISERIGALLARQALTTAAEAGMAATGVGAPVAIVVAAVDKLIAAGIGLSIIYDAYQLYMDYEEWSAANSENPIAATDATRLAANDNTPDATRIPPVGGSSTSSSQTGRPEEAMAFFTSPAGGGWTREQAAGIVANLVHESRLDPNIPGDGGRAYGIAQWHADRQANFQRAYGKSIRGSTFQEQLQFVNWELNNTEAAAGRALRGARTAEEATRIVSEKYERAGTPMMERRLGNASALMAGDYAAVGTTTSNSFSSAASDLASSAADMTLNGMKSFGGIIKGLGREIVGERTYTPMSTQTEDNARAISQASREIETTMTLGKNKSGQASEKMSNAIKSLVQAQPTNTIQAIDPNYGGGNIITNYLQYHKLGTPKSQAAA